MEFINARYFLYSQICHKKDIHWQRQKNPSKFSLVEVFQLGELLLRFPVE